MKYYKRQFQIAAPLPLTNANYPHGFTFQVRTEHGHTNFLTLSAEKFAPIMAAIIAAEDGEGADQAREFQTFEAIERNPDKSITCGTFDREDGDRVVWIRAHSSDDASEYLRRLGIVNFELHVIGITPTKADGLDIDLTKPAPLRLIAEMRGGCLVSFKSSTPPPGVTVEFDSVDYDNCPSEADALISEDAARERAWFEAIEREAEALPVTYNL